MISDRYIVPGIFLLSMVFLAAAGCGGSSSSGSPGTPDAQGYLRISYNPYGETNWSQDFRLKAQPHDHVGTTTESRLLAYDNAGYDVVSLMTYSGVASVNSSWRERRWPVEDWLSASFLNGLQNIKFFVPNGEEIGYTHLTSPFLTTYIAKWEPGYYSRQEPWHYFSSQGAIDLITAYGGLAFIAHPWNGYAPYAELRGYTGTEIYSAYARYHQLKSTDPYFTNTDRNAVMVGVWDQMLLKNPLVRAIAVNDWYGPWNDDPALDNGTKDSGKIVVLAHDMTSAGYRNAIDRGAFFAVKDIGNRKDRYPNIRSISADDNTITIDTDGSVSWIADGVPIGQGPTIRYNPISLKTLYLRAEIVNPDGSTVYTQAFVLKPL